ncbi:MAG: T9SS type B sorting domain-containing protein [Polaribacter sp.]
MKNFYCFIIFFFLGLFGFSQCPDDGDVFLSSQEEVDNFVANYSGCNTINGNLRIANALTGEGGGTGGAVTDITDLSQLNFIEIINGKLTITVEFLELNNFYNLIEVHGDIEITNSKLLEIIEGFNNLEIVNSIIIAINENLKTINGFNKIETIGESLEIGFNPKLVNILGFTHLKNIITELNISENPDLVTVASFNQLEKIDDDLNFTSNPNLLLTNGFNSLHTVGNDFNIELTKGITGFNSLKSIGRFFDIVGIDVQEIADFNALEFIGAGFRIENTSITKIEGFTLLNKIGHLFFLEDWFILSNNPNLNIVIGFGNLIEVDGFFQVINNTSMSDCSWMCYLFNNGIITGQVTVQNNLGDCSNIAAIIEICNPDFDNDGIANIIDLDDDNDGIRDTVEQNGFQNKDTDSDGFPDSKDLDSDNDNCFDVLEAGFSDPNDDGILGDLPDTVDSNGLIINEPTGYTNPADADNNSIFDFQESNTLDPGENNILEICLNNPAVDLFSVLGGNPDVGGTWSPSLSSGTGVFDPTIDLAGIYTYTHFNAICGDASAAIQVEFASDLNSGLDAEIIVCDQSGIVDLFSVLGGNPTSGGSWSPVLASGSGLFNPNIDVAGIYTYTLTNRECGTVSSTVDVKLLNNPNTGISRKISVCEFSEQINLFDMLGGNPNTNGTWSPSLVSEHGIFNPQLDSSGVYTYTIDNGICGMSSSTVEVVVLSNSEITDATIQINDFSSDPNSVQIAINSPRTYEYSLDGFNYQKENIFRNLEGGNHTVYARGINGCEYYQKTIFIKTFPKFFTPNGDSINDFWGLKKFPDVNYTVYIYNRYGKMVKKLINKGDFWDGKKDGENVQSSNYWFKVLLETGEVLHGNFSLIRK